jgi:hypothetical protein
VLSNQHIVRFDVTMQDILIMGILQSRSKLFEVLCHGSERDLAPFGVVCPKRSTRGVIQDEKRCSLLDIKVEQAHDVRMPQSLCSLGFGQALHAIFPLLFLLILRMHSHAQSFCA